MKLTTNKGIITALTLDGKNNTTDMNAAIDIAKANNALVIFYGHGVYETNPAESIYPNPTKASAISDALDYAISEGVEIKTMKDIFI